MRVSRTTARSPRISRQDTTITKAPQDRPFVARAKLFANGRSQAVRLPKEFRLEGKEVLIHREGRRLILEPLDTRGWPVDLWERLDEISAGVGDEWQRPADPVPPPIERERDLP
jgi:antitoxin VapB